MDYRSAYIRRSRKGVHQKKRLAAIGLLGLAGCATLYALAQKGKIERSVVAQAIKDLNVNPEKVFPQLA